MVDFTDIPALDVAIGLAFLYFVLSIVCSSIAEIVASIFRIRAKNLETGIRTLLGSKVKANEFYANWRIKSLGTPKWWRNADKQETSRKPSYISPRAFALAALDTFAPPDPEQPSANVITRLETKLEQMPEGLVKHRLKSILASASGELEAVRTQFEESFNEVMDRATGWYKRKVQVILFVIALAVSAGLNADTLNVADRLARDDAVRAAVVAQAEAQVKEGLPPDPEKPPTAKDVEQQIEQARATALPLGWTDENVGDSKLSWLAKVGGLLITAFALMLGAPFWFDVLGRAARLRSTGNRIGTPKDDDLAPTDRDARPRRRVLRI